MTICFYLNNEEETTITIMYDMVSNPFKKGDIINLNVEEIHPVELNKFTDKYKKILLKTDRELKEIFHLKEIKLVREGKYINFNTFRKKLIIEYHCEIIK